jgi:hypothetical protein
VQVHCPEVRPARNFKTTQDRGPLWAQRVAVFVTPNSSSDRLTQQNRVFPEKLTVPQVLTMFTTDGYIPFHAACIFKIHFNILPSILGLPSSLFSRGEKSKAIPVTGRGGSQGCETSRLPHFLDNRLTDGGEVSLTRRPAALDPQEDSWYSFLLEAVSTPEP